MCGAGYANGGGDGGDDMTDGEGGRGTGGSVGVGDDVDDEGEEDVEAERALAADLVVGAGPITCCSGRFAGASGSEWNRQRNEREKRKVRETASGCEERRQTDSVGHKRVHSNYMYSPVRNADKRTTYCKHRRKVGKVTMLTSVGHKRVHSN
jgi:hypothetical protein